MISLEGSDVIRAKNLENPKVWLLPPEGDEKGVPSRVSTEHHEWDEHGVSDGVSTEYLIWLARST